MALTTYESQVDFIKMWLREGRCERAGTWSNGRAHGDMWTGTFKAWRVHFKTCGRILVPGSFRVRCLGSVEV